MAGAKLPPIMDDIGDFIQGFGRMPAPDVDAAALAAVAAAKAAPVAVAPEVPPKRFSRAWINKKLGRGKGKTVATPPPQVPSSPPPDLAKARQIQTEMLADSFRERCVGYVRHERIMKGEKELQAYAQAKAGQEKVAEAEGVGDQIKAPLQAQEPALSPMQKFSQIKTDLGTEAQNMMSRLNDGRTQPGVVPPVGGKPIALPRPNLFLKGP